MEEIIQFIINHWGLCAFVIGCFIQFTPGIKFNPLEALGNLIFKNVYKRLDKVEARQMEDEKDRIRYEVLDFANSCRNKRRHTKDEFQHIFDLNDKYEELLEQTKDKNGVFTAEFEYIKGLYKRCQEQNDFLA